MKNKTKQFGLGLAVLFLIISIFIFCSCNDGAYNLPPVYDTTIVLVNLSERVFVKDYSINNGVLTFHEYYTSHYSAEPRDHYFDYYEVTINTSMFTIFPHKLEY